MSGPIPYHRAVFAAVHNAYSGGERRGLHAQLDGGVRALELDVTHGNHRFAVGHGVTGYQVSRAGANPVTNRLRDWLAHVRRWSEAHPGHAPLTLVLDVKHRLASRGDHTSLSVFGRLCRDVFEGRLVEPAEAARGWPSVDAMRDRTVLVLSGDRVSRRRCLRDRGREPAVAASRAGVLEAHRSHGGSDLWYWAGDVVDGRPRWLWHDRYGRGATPAVALNDLGHAVSLSRAVGSDNLWVRAGRLLSSGRIDWGGAKRLGGGRRPGLRFLSPAGRTLLATYETPGGARVQRRGRLDIGRLRLDWDAPRPTADPIVPDRAGDLRVRSLDRVLQWRLGAGPWRPLTYHPLFFVDRQQGDDAWMVAAGPRFASAPAGRDAWARARLAEGNVVRLWRFDRKHASGPAVQLPATDAPFARWYRDLLASRGAVV